MDCIALDTSKINVSVPSTLIVWERSSPGSAGKEIVNVPAVAPSRSLTEKVGGSTGTPLTKKSCPSLIVSVMTRSPNV